MVKIIHRATWWKKVWQVQGIYVYKCPGGIEKKENGFSPDVSKDPLKDSALLKKLLDAADRDGIRKAKMKCFGKNYEKKKLPVFYRESYNIIVYAPQKQRAITDFVPDEGYKEKKTEFELNEDREAEANRIYRKDNPDLATYKKNKFVTQEEYNFLQSYYTFDKTRYQRINRNERIRLGIKYRGVINSWGTMSERKKKIEELRRQNRSSKKKS